ncbi:MAG: hypothetical protein K0Q79_272 [Flavipsychrobacter sp.]|jgi:hypothetical protein|nr:hypothetical protein [Flavipsychrobacter sp.]
MVFKFGRSNSINELYSTPKKIGASSLNDWQLTLMTYLSALAQHDLQLKIYPKGRFLVIFSRFLVAFIPF